jgi:hypothetical protein
MHVTDWGATLLEAAGIAPPSRQQWPWDQQTEERGAEAYIDAVSAWPMLARNASSRRTEILHNIHEVAGSAALRVSSWKIVVHGKKEAACDGWYDGVAGLQRGTPAVPGGGIDCGDAPPIACDFTSGGGPCLFELDSDPCERRDRSKTEPQKLAQMLARLHQINGTAVPCLNNPHRGTDAWWWPAANPALHGGAWVPWVAANGDDSADGWRPRFPPVSE